MSWEPTDNIQSKYFPIQQVPSMGEGGMVILRSYEISSPSNTLSVQIAVLFLLSPNP